MNTNTILPEVIMKKFFDDLWLYKALLLARVRAFRQNGNYYHVLSEPMTKEKYTTLFECLGGCRFLNSDELKVVTFKSGFWAKLVSNSRPHLLAVRITR